MSFIEVVDRVIELLRSRERIAYLTLQVEFDLSDKQLAALRAELIDAKRLAVDEDDKVLVWTGDAAQMSDQQPDPKAKSTKRRSAKARKSFSTKHRSAKQSMPVGYPPPYLAERILAERQAMESRGSADGEPK